MRQQNWWWPEALHLFLEKLSWDTSDSGWAIDKYLREAITPIMTDQPPPVPHELIDDPFKQNKLQETLYRFYSELNPSKRQAIISELTERNDDQLILHYNYEQAFWEYFQSLSISEAHFKAISQHLKFKYALLKQPDWYTSISKHPLWLRLITALYGGYLDYGIACSMRDYLEIAAYLKMSEHEKKTISHLLPRYLGYK